VRLYTQSILQNQILCSFLEERSSENLKIRCSCWQSYDLPSQSANYDQFKQQGFEIARRLQDAKALQAFREEAFLNARMTQEFPDPKALDTFDMEDMDELLENMLRKMVAKSPERTETNASPTQTNDEQYATRFWEEEDFGFGFPFGELSPPPTDLKTETQVPENPQSKI